MVLLVDDQAIIGEAIRRALANQEDIDFHFCSNGDEAMEAALRIRPMVILQDLVMPGIDGLQLVRAYRSHPQTSRIPVIVLSVRDEPAIKLAAFEAGANDYIVKLPDPVELLARIRYHANALMARLQLEEALRALRESQQQLLDSNTVLLSLNQKLEAATRAKSDFLAMMSHEIRTPLNAVLGFSDLLGDTSLTAVQHDYVETIRSSGRTLLTVINDVLDFSKIEAGKLDIEAGPFEIRRCIREACELFEAKAVEAGTLIRWEIDDGLPPVILGDAVRIRQVLTNLISNAVKFTRAGSIHVFATLGNENELLVNSLNGDKEAKPGFLLRVSVRDTGPGIPESKRPLLFQSFRQLHSPGKNPGGTGLGLTICKRLCQLMGGDIWLAAHPPVETGTGAEFVFMISAVEASIDYPFDSAEHTETPDGSFPELFRGVRTLVAEDNTANAKLIRALLHKQGIEAETVATGPARFGRGQGASERPDFHGPANARYGWNRSHPAHPLLGSHEPPGARLYCGANRRGNG